jgi:sugar phosphate isomerase/epimerase
MMTTARMAQKLGAATVAGFTGSSIWSFVSGYPNLSTGTLREALKDFVRRWNPILDVFGESGVKFACKVGPGQLAFDRWSAQMVLDALDARQEFGFLFDPSQLHWQGVDPAEFLRHFPDRIYHVHIKDLRVNLSGSTSLLNSYLPPGDPRRGWDYRSPGHGGIDWESVIRALNQIGYDGPLSVDWEDAGMRREHGIVDARKFVSQLDFEGPAIARDAIFEPD